MRRPAKPLPELLGRGIYSPATAASLAGITSGKVRRWVQGYRFVYQTHAGIRSGSSPPVIRTDLPAIDRSEALSFVELIEVLVVGALLRRGVALRTIRRAAKRAARMLGTSHPFAYQRFKTDGKGIFVDLAKQSAEFQHLLIELAGGQYAFPQILNRYLEEIEFDPETLMAVRWWPLGKKRPVVLDPGVAFGEPVIAGTRIPVSVITYALRAGETEKNLCHWYGLQPKHIRAAVAFERQRVAA